MYAESLRKQARNLGTVAVALVQVPFGRPGATSSQPTYDLGHAVARLAVVTDRIATAQPEPDGEREPLRSASLGEHVDQLLADEGKFVDAYSIFLFGSQVLHSFARVEVPRRGSGLRPDWASLVKLLDRFPGDPMTSSIRYLNVALVLARDVLAEHYVPGHYPTASYSDASSIRLGRVTPPSDGGEPHLAADTLLRQALGLAPDSNVDPFLDYIHLSEEAVERSRGMNFEQAGLVRKAFQMAGYHETAPVPWILDALLAVLREHAKARGIAVD